MAAGKLVPGKMHDARVGDARREAEIYKEMATTSLDALREQGRHTADTLVDIKGLILALAAQRGTS